jgi:hypothetical protein
MNWMLFDTDITNTITHPEVGPDGVVYVVRNLGTLHAIDPGGAERWHRSDSSIYDAPVVRNDNAFMLLGGVPDFGMPGFMQAASTEDGAVLWQVDLPAENGGNIVPASRAMFAPRGATAFFGAAYLSPQPQDEYSYLYAIDVAPAVPGDASGDGVVDVADIVAVLLSWGPCPAPPAGCPADVNGDGRVDVADLLLIIVNWT